MADINVLVRGILLATILVVLVKFVTTIFRKSPGPLPPGPRGLPLLGNVLDLPPKGEREYEHWLKHKDIYGPISSVTALGKTIVILHSAKTASELFEKKSLVYSSRTNLVFAGLAGWGDSLPLVPYDKSHRLQRKLAHIVLGTPMNITPYLPLQYMETHRFLFRVLQKPELLTDHIMTLQGAVILKVVYGYTVEPRKPDPLVRLINETMHYFSISVVPGSWLVDIIPSLRYIPKWMPGSGWRKTAIESQNMVTAASRTPLKFARKRMMEGKEGKSFVTEFHKDREDDILPEEETALTWAAFSMYGGGADTTTVTVTVFYLAMTLFPEVRRKAQEELDQVIGTDRLPNISDRDRLPYVNAVVKEALRWHQVAPLGVAHCSTADDIVDGYYIPKGAIVVPNIWWFMHDPAVYPNPFVFDPSRFLGPNPAPDPADHVFGYGRRICPGQYLADVSLWLTVAYSLAVFDITKGLDENGREIEPTIQFSPGIISHLSPFKATVKPRSLNHEALIRQVEDLYPWEAGDADELNKIVL
ncbi:cytochrome protein [Nemania serpens]|nr:cytochrome protein [Nemania serpens]